MRAASDHDATPPVSASVKEIAREAIIDMSNNGALFDRQLAEAIILQAIQTALAPVRAELEQAKEAIRAGVEQLMMKSDQIADLHVRLETAEKALDENWVTHQRVVQAESRLATAEADSRRLDWLEENCADLGYDNLNNLPWYCCTSESGHTDEVGKTCREAIDAAQAKEKKK